MSSEEPNEHKKPEAPQRVVVRVDLDALPKTALDVHAKNSRSALAALIRNDLAEAAKAINTLPAHFAENEMQQLLRETGVVSLASTAVRLADDAVRSPHFEALRAMQFTPPHSAQDEILPTLRSSEIFNTASIAKQMAMDVMGLAAQEAQHSLSVSQQFSSQWLVQSAMSDTLRVAQNYAKEIEGLTAAHRAMVLDVRAEVRQLWDAMRHVQAWCPPQELVPLPVEVKENLLALSEAGWYFDNEMPFEDVMYFKEELVLSEPGQIDADLIAYFREALDRIEATLIRHHPDRTPFIRDAFEAHRAGKFTLSVPVLLAQADGICLDLSGAALFGGNGPFQVARRLEPEALERAYLEPLLRGGPMTESKVRRRMRQSHLNRHAVLHGESIDYNTEVVSLRAISFLNFVSHALRSATEAVEPMLAIDGSKEELTSSN